MRRRIVISSIIVLVILTLTAAVGHFMLGWWRPLHKTTEVTTGGFDKPSETTTLTDVLANSHQILDDFERNVRDYSAVIVKKERIGSKEIETVMFSKIREKPFSVYLYFLDRSDDKSVKGREVIYVEGKNNNNLIGHSPGLLTGGLVLSLPPKGLIPMHDEHYPITEIGLANLCRQLIKRGEEAGDPQLARVKRFPHARINSRKCSLLEISFPAQKPGDAAVVGGLARVFLDDEWKFPIRVEVYDLLKDQPNVPRLFEEYTYLDLKLNRGYADADFDRKNRQYKFP